MDVIIRPVRLEDAEALQEMRTRPRCVWGTLQLPTLTAERVRKQIAEMPETVHSLVAEVEGRAVGQISLHLGRGRSAHCGQIGMMVHDRFRPGGEAAAQGARGHAGEGEGEGHGGDAGAGLGAG